MEESNTRENIATAASFEEVAIFVDPRKRVPIVLGIFAAITAGSLVTGALNTILPVICREIGGLEYFSLAFVAATFGGVLGSPIAGALSDVLNKKRLFIVSGIIAVLTMAMHAMAPSMFFIIALRFINSFSTSVILVTGLGFIASIFPPKERVKWLGFYGTAMALGSLIGPPLGSVCASGIGWRWFFYIVAAITLLGVADVAVMIPPIDTKKGAVKLDGPGLTVYAVLLVLLVVFINFGGSLFQYISVTGFILIVAIAALIFLFIQVEKKKGARAMIPLSLFGNPYFTLTFIGQFCGTGCKLPFYMYLSLYMQNVLGYSTTKAAAIVTIYAITAFVWSIVFAPLVAKSGRIKSWCLGAMFVLTAVGVICFLAGMFSLYSLPLIVILCALWGCASTMTNTTFTMIAQTTLPKEVIGIATGNIQLAMSLGSMITVAIYGAIISAYGDSLNMGITMSHLAGAVIGVIGIIAISCIKMPRKQS